MDHPSSINDITAIGEGVNDFVTQYWSISTEKHDGRRESQKIDRNFVKSFMAGTLNNV